jgi:hypothetical protein
VTGVGIVSNHAFFDAALIATTLKCFQVPLSTNFTNESTILYNISGSLKFFKGMRNPLLVQCRETLAILDILVVFDAGVAEG